MLQQTPPDFWNRVCQAVSGRPGSGEAIMLFQMKIPPDEVLESCNTTVAEEVIATENEQLAQPQTKRIKTRSARPNRGSGKINQSRETA